MNRLLIFCLLVVCCTACSRRLHVERSLQDELLEQLMQSKPEQFSSILANRDSLNVQIIYTQINRNKHNQPSFTPYTFHLHPNQYFYPASTVKMPVAFLALEKLAELKSYGIDKYSTLITDSAAPKQDMVYNQPLAEDGRPSVANYIRQIFLVSDNNAFNRLYEFLGQGYIQQKLAEKGYADAIIRHRLQAGFTNADNSITNPVQFYDTAGKLLYSQATQSNKTTFPSLNVKLGKGFYQNGKLVDGPFDFSEKNRLYLEDLTHMLQSVLFPESFPEQQRFHFSEDDRQFLLHWMSAYPKESRYPYYDTASYWDSYCKFLLFGSEKSNIPSYIRVFNKVGDAYGFLTDVAYVIDIKHNVEFMLSATILCNSKGIFNSDQYDYETLGLPFMKNIGQLVYQYELTRKRKYKPNLGSFILNYNE
ncbi:MAG: serine hydrolase [Bacteroidota bacterium]|nr:serine hydrolase [Bacteroidota bacterium]